MTSFRKGNVEVDVDKTSDSFKGPDGKLPESTLRRFVGYEIRNPRLAEEFIETFRAQSPDADKVEWGQ